MMPREALLFATIMLIAGLAIGSVATTQLWQGPMERRGKLVEAAQAQTAQAIKLANNNIDSLEKCTASLRSVAGVTK